MTSASRSPGRRGGSFFALTLALALGLGRDGRADVVPGGAPTELTVDEVVRSALDRHPAVAAADRERAVAAADLLSASGGFDPLVRGRAAVIPFGPYPNERIDIYVEQPTTLWGTRMFAGWRLGQGEFAVYDGKLETAPYGEIRGGLGVPLLRDGAIDRRRAVVRRAELGSSIAALTAEEQRLEISEAAAHRYWDWVIAGRNVEIARELLAYAVERDAGLRAQVERGAIPAFEQSENERVIHRRTAELGSAQRRFENAAIELSMYLRDASGRPTLPDPARLPRAMSAPTGADLASATTNATAALERRPEPKRLATAAGQAQVDLDLARNQKLLGLDVVIAAAKDLGPWDPKLTRTELEAMVLVDVPLLNRVSEGRARAAEAKSSQAALGAQLARDRVVADVRDAESALALARQRALASRREVDVSKALVAQELRRFELGDGTLLLVNLREQALAEAQQREVSALGDYQKARASLRRARGETGAR